MKNSIEELKNSFGILTTWENGTPYFSGVTKVLLAKLNGDDNIYREVSLLMRDIEDNKDKYITKDERIIIQAPKHILVLYPSEIQRAILRDEELYIKALRRGKSELRYRANEKRNGVRIHA